MTLPGRSFVAFSYKLTMSLLITFLVIMPFAMASNTGTGSNIDEFHFSIPVTVWKNNNNNYKGIIIAIHGLTMHSGSYAVMAQNLSNLGYLVVAPDLRGFGQWMDTHTLNSQLQSVDYEASYEDIARVITFVQEKYPNTPTFILGESLGADFALRIASSQQFKLQGMILSAPAIVSKPPVVASVVLSELPRVIMNPKHEVNVEPFLAKYISCDESIIESTINDPYVRKNLTVADLLSTLKTLASSLSYAKKISPNLPVLILQGTKDALVNPKGVDKLVQTLKTKDSTVKIFNGEGHLLLETSQAKPKTLLTLNNWVENHTTSNPPEQMATLTFLDKTLINNKN